jgi:hypothetical protein
MSWAHVIRVTWHGRPSLPMSAFLAGVIVYVAVSCVVSGLLFLPAAALVESLPPGRPSRETLIRFAALLIPHLCAVAAVWSAWSMHEPDPVPWAFRNDRVRHLCFWWIVDNPDVGYRVTILGALAVAMVAFGVVRPMFSAALAWRYERMLARASTPVPDLDVWLTPLDRPWSTCVGFFNTRVYLTKGLAELLDPEELATVIAHEQAHAGRRDNLKLLAAQVLLAPVIIMPSAHHFYRRLRVSMERAADLGAAEVAAEQEVLASALVKAARRLRDFGAEPDEEPLRRRMANRYREDFVAERAQELLAAAEEQDEEGRGSKRASAAFRVGLVVSAIVVLGLVVAGAGFVPPSVRCLFESLLAVLQRAR